MSLSVKGITAAKWSTLAAAVTAVVQLAQVVILSRLLSPADYGMMSMIMVVVGLAVSMNDFGVSSAIIHRQQVSPEELSSLYYLNLAAGALLGAVVWLIAPVACAYYQESDLLAPMRWMSLLCFLPAIGQQFQVLFQKELRFEYLAKADIASAAAGFAVAIGGAIAGFGVYALVGAYLANALLKSAMLAARGWREWRPQFHFARRDLRGYIRFGAYQTGSNVIQSFTNNIDYLILGRLLGAEGLGYYSFAFQLCTMPMQKLWPLVSQVSLPLLAKIQNSPKLLKQGYYQITEAVGYATGPIYLGLAVTAPDLVPFAFGSQWTNSIAAVQILAVMFLLRASVLPTQSLLLAVGRADTRFHYSVVCLAVIAPCLFVGAWTGSVLGAAFGYLAAQAVIVVANYFQSIRKVLGKSAAAYAGSYLPGVGYSALMAAAVWTLGRAAHGWSSGLALVAWQLFSGVVLYAALLWLFERDRMQHFRKLAMPGQGLQK